MNGACYESYLWLWRSLAVYKLLFKRQLYRLPRPILMATDYIYTRNSPQNDEFCEKFLFECMTRAIFGRSTYLTWLRFETGLTELQLEMQIFHVDPFVKIFSVVPISRLIRSVSDPKITRWHIWPLSQQSVLHHSYDILWRLRLDYLHRIIMSFSGFLIRFCDNICMWCSYGAIRMIFDGSLILMYSVFCAIFVIGPMSLKNVCNHFFRWLIRFLWPRQSNLAMMAIQLTINAKSNNYERLSALTCAGEIINAEAHFIWTWKVRL